MSKRDVPLNQILAISDPFDYRNAFLLSQEREREGERGERRRLEAVICLECVEIIAVIADFSGDFLSQRFEQDVWPFIHRAIPKEALANLSVQLSLFVNLDNILFFPQNIEI